MRDSCIQPCSGRAARIRCADVVPAAREPKSRHGEGRHDMNNDAFAVAWFAGLGIGGFDDMDTARRVLGEREREMPTVKAQVIISVSLDDLDGLDGDLLF